MQNESSNLVRESLFYYFTLQMVQRNKSKSKQHLKLFDDEASCSSDSDFNSDDVEEDSDDDYGNDSFIVDSDDDEEDVGVHEYPSVAVKSASNSDEPQQKKQRGRPRKERADDISASWKNRKPGDDHFPVNNFSLTISKCGGDVDLYLLDRVHGFLQEFCIKGGVSTEVGHRAHMLHLQSLFSVRYPKDKEHVKELTKLIKGLIQPPSTGYRIVIKPFAVNQTVQAMIGYITKDQGQPHYQLRTHHISPSELDAGRREHMAMLSSFDDSKKIVNIKNFFNECYKFNRRCMFPCVVPIDYCITYMIQSGNYILTPDFISMYRKFDFTEAQLLWDMIHHPLTADVEGVTQIIFNNRSYDKRFMKRYYIQGMLLIQISLVLLMIYSYLLLVVFSFRIAINTRRAHK